ncbi:MAG: hyuA2 [Marmoricola sp.]|nr:hyuA2 [Marmoricola sp.]
MRRIGIDVGGTFTDAILVDDELGTIDRTKVLTTANDQSIGTLEAIRRLAGDNPVDSIVHGYTVGLNAALTRNGAKTALLVTAGHRGLVDSGRLSRPNGDSMYDPTWERPHDVKPLVDRRLRRGVPERMREDGEVLLELDEAAVRSEVEFIREQGVTSVGICFIHGYVHPQHEARVEAIVREMMPDAYVQTSKIWPLAREYERTFVVLLDAYTGPPILKYLKNLEGRLSDGNVHARLDIMQMDGGLRNAGAVREAPIYTLQSGPVAGLLGAEFYSNHVLAGRDLVCLDIGGTSTDIGIIAGGEAEVTNEWELEHAIPLSITTLDVRSVGAGGGSLIRVDDIGSLDVSEESAGSDPGPACYGRGGTRPAMTDAYTALGLLQPDLFLGGEMKLVADAADLALAELAKPLGMSSEELARGAYEIANVKIAAAVRQMTVDRGMDPRTFSLFPFGAAGPMHAVAVARLLDIDEVVVPYFPGGFSAFGMIASRSKVSHARALMEPLSDLEPGRLSELLAELEGQCRADLESEAIDAADVSVSYAYYGMYAGQGYDNRLPLPREITSQTIESLTSDFHAFYDSRYGYQAPEIPIVVTSVVAVAIGPMPSLVLPESGETRQGGIESAVLARRPIHLARHGEAGVFYDRDSLVEGDEISGPAVIDDKLGTIVVPTGAVARVADRGTIRIAVR